MPKRKYSGSSYSSYSSSSRSRSRSRSNSSSSCDSFSNRNNPSKSRALVAVAPMPDPDSLQVVDFLHNLQEINAIRSDKIDSRIYVDNLSNDTVESEFIEVFIGSMKVLGLITRPGDPLIST